VVVFEAVFSVMAVKERCVELRKIRQLGWGLVSTVSVRIVRDWNVKAVMVRKEADRFGSQGGDR